ncbi:MAG TPA: Ig-like domain-containing protein, partial [Anaerolineae bacterium]|nr:Ig-like domain-containing protein [Anaerolineae bacterium]
MTTRQTEWPIYLFVFVLILVILGWGEQLLGQTVTATADFGAQIEPADTLVTIDTSMKRSDVTIEKNDIMAVNIPPVANNDIYTTSEDMPLVVPTVGVLVNDTDGDGDSLAVYTYTQPAMGTVILGANGAFTYTPPLDWYGVVSYTYVISDGNTMNVGSGNFSAGDTFSAGDSWGIVFGDVDGDGDLDVAVANVGGLEEIWLNDGSGNFSVGDTFGGGSSRSIVLGDVDGDGDLDAAVANDSNQAQEIWLNDGSGNFSAGDTFGLGSSRGIALGDVDGDGDLDVAVANDGEQE